MNPVTIATASVGLVGAIYGGILGLDARYAQRGLVEDLVWSGMRRELRELRREVDDGQATEDEYEELLARFCRQYPDDRLCSA